jgi:hypothetical protein
MKPSPRLSTCDQEIVTLSDEKTLKDILDLEKSLGPSSLDELAQASTRASEALRHLYENSGIERMTTSIVASEAALRAALGPAEDLRKQHEALMRASLGPMEELRRAVLVDFHSPIEELRRAAFLDVDSSVKRHIEEAQRAMASYTERFHLPAITETALLLEQLKVDPMRDLLARFAEQESSVQRAMTRMRTPWLDMQEQMRSVAGFAELQGIGAALNAHAVFDESLTAALRLGLGDWRDTITWPKDIFTDLAARSEFYAGLGFNHALTDFPAPAFEQSLDIAGLRREPPLIILLYGAPVAPADDDSEEEGLARTNTAHDWLLRLETQLRSFIDSAMTQSFGPKWPKQRLPNGLYDEWQEKKRKAMQAGGKDWPLIAYADFTDYERVICKGDNWREVFAVFFVRSESVRESLQRLYPIRLDTMHARPITQDDELLLYVETRRIVKVIKKRPN